MKSCVNGSQNNIGAGAITQNPSNGVLLAQKSFVLYRRGLSILPLTAGHAQLLVDQPLMVPSGYILKVTGLTFVSNPDGAAAEWSATAGFMALATDAINGLGAGQSLAADLGAGAGTVTGNFGPVAMYENVFMTPCVPGVVIAPDDLVVAYSGGFNFKQASTAAATSLQTVGGGVLTMPAGLKDKFVLGPQVIYPCILFAPIQTHAVQVYLTIQGILLTADEYLSSL